MSGINTLKGAYIRSALKEGKRNDSREQFQMREIEINREVLSNAEGSARARLGNTDVIAGVKVVVEEPHSDTPEEGNLIVSAELLPMASADFETGPPSPAAIELARVVDRGIRAGSCVDLQSLFIEKGKVYSVYVDIYVLDYDGNLFDVCTIAAMSALMNTRLPKYSDGEVDRKDRSAKLKIDNVVSSATFGKFGGDIILDMNADEEQAADARITITTDGKVVRAMQKGLNGDFSIKEVEQLVDIALKKNSEITGHIKR